MGGEESQVDAIQRDQRVAVYLDQHGHMRGERGVLLAAVMPHVAAVTDQEHPGGDQPRRRRMDGPPIGMEESVSAYVICGVPGENGPHDGYPPPVICQGDTPRD